MTIQTMRPSQYIFVEALLKFQKIREFYWIGRLVDSPIDMK